MSGSSHTVAVLVAAAGLLSSAGPLAVTAQQSPPVLRASVDLVTIDVQVTPAKDAPLRQFTAADFDIRISGQKRPAASATFLHFDEGTVIRNPGLSSPQTPKPGECAFGFHRKVDRPTAHYVLAVDRSEADRRAVEDVQVVVVDKAFAVQTYVWRSPVRSSVLPVYEMLLQYNRSHPWPSG
jgi:hypothetical protein